MSRRRPEPSGFTLLECIVAVLVLSLLAVGLAQLTTHHDKLLAGLEEWTDAEPTYFVAQADDAMERLVGVPATLVSDPPLPPSPPPAPGLLAVTVTEVSLELDPPAAIALAHVEEE